MSALSQARQRREVVQTFVESLAWFIGQCSFGGRYATKGVSVDKAYHSVLSSFNEMRAHITRDVALCDEIAKKLERAYQAFKQGDEATGRMICDALWQLPELKKIR